jgi:hypothetical protein
MADKYRATLHGDRLEWENGSPPLSDEPNGVAVEVSIVKRLKKPDGKKMAAALRALANLPDGGIKSIKDPVKWQREIRKDRPLPGR